VNIRKLLKEIYGKIPAKHTEVAPLPNLEVDETNYSSGMVCNGFRLVAYTSVATVLGI